MSQISAPGGDRSLLSATGTLAGSRAHVSTGIQLSIRPLGFSISITRYLQIFISAALGDFTLAATSAAEDGIE